MVVTKTVRVLKKEEVEYLSLYIMSQGYLDQPLACMYMS